MSRTWPFEEGSETETDSGGERLTPSEEEEEAQPLVIERDFEWLGDEPKNAVPAPPTEKPLTPDPPRIEEPPVTYPPQVEEPPVSYPPRVEDPTQAYQSPAPRPKPAYTAPAYTPPPAPRSRLVSGPRTVKRTIRRVDPWSVLKLSFLFYASVVLVMLFAAMLIFFAADAAGIVGKLETFIQGIGWPDWEIRPIQLFRALLLIGVTNVVIWTAINVFAAFLYNLVADIVGGIQVTFSERDI